MPAWLAITADLAGARMGSGQQKQADRTVPNEVARPISCNGSESTSREERSSHERSDRLCCCT